MMGQSPYRWKVRTNKSQNAKWNFARLFRGFAPRNDRGFVMAFGLSINVIGLVILTIGSHT